MKRVAKYRRIGEMTARHRVSARTLRFWEQSALITPHRKGDQRLYAWPDECRIRIILLAQRCGLSLYDAFDILNEPDWRHRKARFRAICQAKEADLEAQANEAVQKSRRAKQIAAKR